jgi:hypothetical protein
MAQGTVGEVGDFRFREAKSQGRDGPPAVSSVELQGRPPPRGANFTAFMSQPGA